MRGRLVRDGYRGWYGWEDRYNTIIRMSFESMSNTNARNKQERFRYQRNRKQIEKQEQRYTERLDKEMRELKEELWSAKAYGKVCERYSFRRRQGRDNEEGVEQDNGSIRGKDIEKGPIRWRRRGKRDPVIIVKDRDNDRSTNEIRGDNWNILETRPSMDDKASDELTKEHQRQLKRTLILAKWMSAMSLISKLRQDGRPSEEKVKAVNSLEGDNTSRRKHAPIFPAQCRNTFTLRRFIEKEVEHLLTTYTPERARRERVRRILDHSRFPDLVQRHRSTSAIFRNYESYKRSSAYRQNNSHVTEQKSANVNENSLNLLKKKYEEVRKSGSTLPPLVGVSEKEREDGKMKRNVVMISERKLLLPRLERAELVT
ncbi:hypothetical protein LSH36_200g00013 [Paralvinella palmiformis]|uniref:Uncharacterized protein n=1 Tax=Paralvinella palmiformis TaxID=53620 RepID=A0AAD9N6P3_9ANNE|nr:hypothetical protein LSH36_200g00013 [Paralvinella palmiformis]